MHQTSAKVGIELPHGGDQLNASARERPVFPIEPLTVVSDRELAVRHDGCPIGTMQHEPMCHIRLFNHVAMCVTYACSIMLPCSTGEMCPATAQVEPGKRDVLLETGCQPNQSKM